MSSSSLYDASILLPGLKLKSTEGSIPSGMNTPDDDSFAICLKHLDEGLFKLISSQNFSLAVTYLCKAEKPPDYAKDFITANDDENQEFVPNFYERDVQAIPCEKFTDGYYCFNVKKLPSPGKVAETISVDVIFHESDDAELSGSNVDPVGDSYNIDLKAGAGDVSKNLFLLEWDLTNPLMRQVASPEDMRDATDKSGTPEDILYLGINGRKRFNPLEPLNLHVYLHDRPQDLKLKFYGGVEVEPSVHKSFEAVAEDAIASSMTSENLLFEMSLTTVADDRAKFELSPETFLAALQSSFMEYDETEGDGDKGEAIVDFTSVLNENKRNDDKQTMKAVLRAVNTAQFSVMIEDSSGCRAKFLLRDINSNDVFFESAVEILKGGEEWTDNQLVNWSNMVVAASQSICHSIGTDTKYKVTRKANQSNVPLPGVPSLPVSPLPSPNRLHEFEVEVSVPKVVTNGGSFVDPDDVTILVENCDTNLTFAGQEHNNRFLYIRDPQEDIAISTEGDRIKFGWTAIDSGSAPRKAMLNISVILKPNSFEADKAKMIGQAINVGKQIGTGSNQHFIGLELRRAVEMGLVEASGLETSIFHFLEAIFRMAFDFSSLRTNVVWSNLLDDAAGDFASHFYSQMVQSKDSSLYREIMQSPIFTSRPLPSDIREIAETVMRLFSTFLSQFGAEVLQQWSDSYSMDEDFLQLLTDSDEKEQQISAFKTHFGEVLNMDHSSILASLKEYPPEDKDTFLSLGSRVRDELANHSEQIIGTSGISSPPVSQKRSVNDAYDSFSASGLDMTRGEFEDILSVRSLGHIELRSEEIARDLEDEVLFFPQKVKMSRMEQKEVSNMESNLLEMLERTQEGCESSISGLDDVQDFLDVLKSPLDMLSQFSDDISDLSKKAKSLHTVINSFWTLMQALARVAYGPLTALKGIKNAVKNPMGFLLRALVKGKNSIKKLETKVNSKLKKLAKSSIASKIDKVSSGLDKPKAGIEKIREIIGMIIGVASCGALPLTLISKFASSSTLTGVFETLRTSVDEIKSVFKNLLDQTNLLTPIIDSIGSLLSSITSKFIVLKPIQGVLYALQPFVDVINGIFNSFPGWMTWAINAAMWPVEQAVNAIIRPFRSTIQSVINRLNPFSFVDSIVSSIAGPLDSLPGLGELEAKLNIASTLQSWDTFKELEDPLTQVVALIFRGLHTIAASLLSQASRSADVFEQMLGGAQSDAFQSMEKLLGEKRAIDGFFTMGDLILEMKAEHVDKTIRQCDTYLRMNTSDSPYSYNDTSSEKLTIYIGHSTTTSYELAECDIDPTRDGLSPFFKQGSANNSWVMAPLAALLHYSVITEKAAAIGVLDDAEKVIPAFIPQVDSTGKCEISLFPRGGVLKRKYQTDTKLPIAETQLDISGDITAMPQKIIEFAKERISSPVHACFASKYSWALVEKVLACKLKVTQTTREHVGTGMGLLSGKWVGTLYSRGGGNADQEWTKSSTRHSPSPAQDYDKVILSQLSESFTEGQLMGWVKNRTVSMRQYELLEKLQDEIRTDIPGTTEKKPNSELEQAMRNLSIFIIMKKNGFAYPILYTDDTPDEHIVYADGVDIKPLRDLSDSDEIWEYQITSDGTSDISAVQSSKPDPVIMPVQSTTSHSEPLINPASELVHVSADGEEAKDFGWLPYLFVGSLALPILLEIYRSVLDIITQDKDRPFVKDHKNVVGRVISIKKVKRFKKVGKKKETVGYYNLYEIHRLNDILEGKLPHNSNLLRKKKDEILKLTEKELQDYKILQAQGIFERNNGLKNVQYDKNLKPKEQNQSKVPYWGMTLKQLRTYVNYCKKSGPKLWTKKKVNKGYITLTDIKDAFIQPQTRGTGMGVALNMQPKNREKQTEVMISHCWKEDMDQVLEMLERAKDTTLNGGGKFGDNTVIWFCAFAQYQGEDDAGPTVQEQLDLDSFEQVIISQRVKDMFVLQTLTADPYSRMWCAVELGVALTQNKNGEKIKIHPLFAREWLENYIYYDTVNNPRMWVDDTYVSQQSNTQGQEPKFRRQGATEFTTRQRISQDRKKYYLMTKDEKFVKNAQETEPMLKHNIEEGLTEYGKFKVREPDQKVFNEIGTKFASTSGSNDGWEVLQEMIVKFQTDTAISQFENYHK